MTISEETPKVVIPASAKKPQDHKKSAAQIEAEKIETIEVTWRGHTFTVATDVEEWSVDLTEALEAGKAAAMLAGLLGPKQYQEFKSTRPKNRDLTDLSEVLAKALGFTSVGE